jgi:hypothetical protein
MDYGQEFKFYISVPKTYKVFKFNMSYDSEIYNLFEGDYDARAQMVSDDNADKLVEKGAAFSVSYKDQTYYLNKKAYADFKDFVIDLVSDFNIRQKDAEIIANKANSEKDYYVLLDDENNIMTIEKQAQMPMGGGMPAAAPPGQSPTPAPGMGMDMYGAGVMPEQQQMMPEQQLGQMMGTEQPTNKDTAVLLSMANSASTEQIIDKYLPSLLKAINSLGRLLLNLNWHSDKLEERYGEQELEAIKDSTRATFVRLGEIYLKLKEKSYSTQFSEKPEYLVKADQQLT